MSTSPKRWLYFDALPLAQPHKSGVGNVILRTIEALVKLEEVQQHYHICLIVPLGKAKYLPDFDPSLVSVKTLLLPARGLELLLRLRLMPPIDWFVGKGIYIFGNYRNWPLWRSRSLTYFHDATYMRHPEYVQVKNGKYLTRYAPHWLARTDKVITVSEHAKREIHTYLHVPEEKIDVVYNGVDTEYFYPRTTKQVQQVKAKYGVTASAYVLYVGNIEPRKNLERLVQAYRALPARLQQSYTLVIVGGDGWSNEGIKAAVEQAQADGYSVQRITDFVPNDDLPALYSGATALVHPALYEGFGITPLEAMACHTPVVSANSAALPEVVGSAAELFNPEDERDMSQAIARVLQSPSRQKELMRDGDLRVKLFSWQQTAHQLLAAAGDQFTTGYRKRIVMMQLRKIYSHGDNRLRSWLGEKELKPYQPELAATEAAVRTQLYHDFLSEQPSHLQVKLLKLYLWSRHKLANICKGLLRRMKALI